MGALCGCLILLPEEEGWSAGRCSCVLGAHRWECKGHVPNVTVWRAVERGKGAHVFSRDCLSLPNNRDWGAGLSYPDITSACGLPPIGPRALAPLIRQRILTVTLVSRPMNHVCVISLKVGKGKTIQGKTLHLFWLVRLMLQAEEAFFEGMSVLFFSSFFFFSSLWASP